MEAGKWIELTEDHIQWRALVLAVLNFWFLIPGFSLLLTVLLLLYLYLFPDHSGRTV